MKFPAKYLLLIGALGVSCPVFGQDAAVAEREQVATPPAAPAEAAPPASDAPEAPVAPSAGTAPSETAVEDAAPPLRRLDVPSVDETSEKAEAAAEAVSAPANEVVEETAAAATQSSSTKTDEEGDDDSEHDHDFHHRSHGHGDERVVFGDNATLGAGDSADAVVSIFGSSTSAGEVGDAVVSILGSSTSSGRVGDAVVSILGNSRVTGGTVRGGVVSVLGSTYVNARVHGEVVAVLGDVELGPDAEVNEVVCIGGTVKRDPGAIVHNSVNNVGFGISLGGLENSMSGLQAWFTQCLLLGRPLAFAPNLMWAWWIAIAFLGFYLLIAAIFPGGVEKCARTLEERPGFSILASVLAVLVAPVVIVLLCVSVIGIAIVPFLGAAILFATLFGKAVMLTWLGRRVTKHVEAGAMRHAVLSTLIGGVLVLLLYVVPVLGFVVYKALGVLGLGVVVYTLILGMNRKPAVAAASGFVPPTTGAVPPGAVPVSGPAPTTSAGFSGATVDPTVPPQFIAPPVAVAASTLHRAGFWIRFAASVLDALIVGVTVGLLPSGLQPNFFFAYAVYCVILWALKGTTIGGIVCNLKVVRVDDRPMDWPTALVRALGGVLSLLAAGIGFIWVAFDDQRQSWHDKIAGTTVVQMPKGVSLL